MLVTLSFCRCRKCEACQLEYLLMLVSGVALDHLEYLRFGIGNLKDAVPVCVADAFDEVHSACGWNKANLKACYA